MVKLRRVVVEDEGITGMPDASSFPQKAVMYYGLKPEAKQQEYQIYYTIYDEDRTPSKILNSDMRPDFVMKSTSRHSLEKDLQNSNFLTNKDFGAINKHRNKDTHTFIGYIIEPTYTSDKSNWDYAKIFLDNKNNIILKWRH